MLALAFQAATTASPSPASPVVVATKNSGSFGVIHLRNSALTIAGVTLPAHVSKRFSPDAGVENTVSFSTDDSNALTSASVGRVPWRST